MILGSVPSGYASKGMHQALLPNKLPETTAGGFRVCARYAPNRILSGLKKATLDDIAIGALGVCVEGYAPGSIAQLTSRNTSWQLWGMRQVCAG